ncbi:MAG: hypothetical protein ACI9H6_000754 [Patiriisocius sp.]|jgi:hypothetical protein
MKRFSEQFQKKANGIRLRASERNDLRDRLTTYMEYHPLPADMKAPKKTVATQTLGIVSEPFKAISFNMTYVRSFAGVFMLFVVVGVPLIAERSVPGDVLYPVKTQITEELRSSLTLSSYAKVEWETERLERRVSEARLLASEGLLTPEAEAAVAIAVKEHTDAAVEGIAALREDSEDDAAIAEIAFASALSVQSEALGEQTADEAPESGDGRSVAILAGLVQEVSSTADASQAAAVPSYEGILGRIEIETTRAYELFESVQKQASDEEIVDIQRRLADVERKVEEAISLRASETTEVPDVEELPVVVEEVVVEEVIATTTAEEIVNEEAGDNATSTEEVVEDITEEVNEEAEEEIPEVVEVPQEPTITAAELLRTAMMDVRKLISFMTNIDVRQNITIEELVPVTLTSEEKSGNVTATFAEIDRMQAERAERVVLEDFVEKYALGEVSLTAALERAYTASEIGDHNSAQAAADEAVAIITDLLAFTTQAPEAAEEEAEEVEESIEEEEVVVAEEVASTTEATEEE